MLGTTEFQLLGRVEAYRDGGRIELGRRRERCLLAVLLLRAGTIVGVDRLLDLLWDESPTPTARASLHTHVSRLRGRLDPDGSGRYGVRLTARQGGYLAEVDPHSVDAHRFRAQVVAAREVGDPAEKARLLRQALALWRGPLLADVASDRLRDRIAGDLAELHMTAIESAVDAELACGRHTDLMGELVTMTTEHPLNERLAGQYMLAAYGCGRTADALEGYQRLRRRLADELGVDPSPALRELHQRILTEDPALTAVEPAAEPRQLPAPPRLFTGRTRELSELDKAVREDTGGAVVISAIGGGGGIGKTWLALHWAHHNIHRFPDGQLYVNLRGFDPAGDPVDPAVAVRGVLTALGVNPAVIPVAPDAGTALYRSLLTGKRMLLVLDNARDTDQVVPLLPGDPSCTVLVTSRSQLTGLMTTHGARPLALDVLDPDDARELLIRYLGHDRVAAEPEAATALLDLCAGLPLAVGIVAARAAGQPGCPLSALAEELTEARLDALNAGERAANVRAVFSSSYRALSPDSAHVFELLGLAPGPDISLPAAASLTDRPLAAVRVLLRELENAHLVRQHLSGRYRMHDLVKLYAAEKARDTQEAALLRLIDFYLHTAHVASGQLFPQRQPIELDAAVSGCVPHPLDDRESALAWFIAEHPCLSAAHQWTARHRWDRLTWQLAWTLTTFRWRQGHLHEDLAAWQVGLAAADRLAEPATQALAHRFLGEAHDRLGQYSAALHHLQCARILFDRVGDPGDQARVHLALTHVWEAQGDYAQALIHATHTRRLVRALGNPGREGHALNAIGWCHARLGQYEQARTHCEQALALCRAHDDCITMANILDSLGYIAHHTGRHTDALRHYQDALALFHDVGSTYDKADIVEHLGETLHDAGRRGEARRAWRQALSLYQSQHRAAQARRVSDRLAALGDA